MFRKNQYFLQPPDDIESATAQEMALSNPKMIYN